ncbi:TPA: transcription antitermination factor NusB [bacterium]|nr:transcription antitermination factor NusB [bacterium]
MRKRTKARESALQILYQVDITNDNINLVLEQYWKERKRNPEVIEFANQLTKGTISHLTEIDKIISSHSENWNIERMPIIDRNIIRLATYEILYIDDIPSKVTIDEAVDLANRFGSINSGKFVNGVLDKIMTLGKN